MMFLIFSEENIFGNYVVTKKKGSGTGVVPAKWTLIIKSVMT